MNTAINGSNVTMSTELLELIHEKNFYEFSELIDYLYMHNKDLKLVTQVNDSIVFFDAYLKSRKRRIEDVFKYGGRLKAITDFPIEETKHTTTTIHKNERLGLIKEGFSYCLIREDESEIWIGEEALYCFMRYCAVISNGE